MKPVQLIQNEWRYSIGDVNEARQPWKTMNFPCVKMPEHENSSLWLTTKLPNTTEQDPAIYIRAINGPFRVLVDGKLIYQFGYEHGKPSEKFLGHPWHLIRLPQNSSNKEISFVTKINNAKSGVCTEVYHGELSAFTEKLSVDGVSCAVIATVAALLGIAGIIISIATRTKKTYLAFAGYALTVGLWLFSNPNGPAFRLFLIPSPRLWGILDLTGLYLTPVFSAMFFRQIAIGDSLSLRAIKLAQWAHFAFAAAVLPLGIANIIDLGRMNGPFNRILPFFLLALAIEAIRRIRRGQTEERIFAVGAILFLSLGIHDFLIGSGILAWKRHISHWGLLVQLLSLAWIIARVLKRQIEAAALAAEKTKNALHDIKTPLASLGSKIESLETVSKEIKDSIKANITRMRAIVSAQRDFDLSRAPAQVQVTTIGEVLTILKEEMTPVADVAGVSFDFIIPHWSFHNPIRVNKIDLLRAFENITQNAIQASVQREPVITVAVQKSGQNIQISVRDFGPGFTAKALTAFQNGKFYSTKAEGFGRGLLSSKNIIRSTGGSLSVISNETGATVTVSLPTTSLW